MRYGANSASRALVALACALTAAGALIRRPPRVISLDFEGVEEMDERAPAIFATRARALRDRRQPEPGPACGEPDLTHRACVPVLGVAGQSGPTTARSSSECRPREALVSRARFLDAQVAEVAVDPPDDVASTEDDDRARLRLRTKRRLRERPLGASTASADADLRSSRRRAGAGSATDEALYDDTGAKGAARALREAPYAARDDRGRVTIDPARRVAKVIHDALRLRCVFGEPRDPHRG